MFRGSSRALCALASLGGIGIGMGICGTAGEELEGVKGRGIDAVRLCGSLEELNKIGLEEDGSITRVAFSEEDIAARALLREWMESSSMDVRVDAAGNLIGRYAGEEDELPVLMVGSHIDTVPHGGRFDGTLGVLAGLEVVRTLQDQGIRLRHPVEVVAFADEESSMIGSKAMAGLAPLDASAHTTTLGLPLDECVARVGGKWEDLQSAKRRAGSIAAFLELHIEQGGVLETYGEEIGVVEGVVGLQRFAVDIVGRPNHAGTTPMTLRQDALVAASHIVADVEGIAGRRGKGGGGRGAVATVGKLVVSPNAANIVPGKVHLTVDMRDLSIQALDRMATELQAAVKHAGEDTGCSTTLSAQFRTSPTLAHPHLQDAIAKAATHLGLSRRSMPSRASHDAQSIGRIAPMGMVFVPSKHGISHAPDEYSSPQQCADGTAVLLETLKRIDQSLD